MVWLSGNFTIDTKIFNENSKTITQQGYGGSVFFGSWTIATFFKNVSYKIFSNGYPHLLLTEGSSPKNVLALSESIDQNDVQKLTHYVLDYRTSIRKLQLNFFPPDVITFPHNTDVLPNIIMFTPVYHELAETSAEQLKDLFPKVLLSCDPQGWCRIRDQKTNLIKIKQWIPSDEFLSAVSIIKMSSEDLLNSSNRDLDGFIKRILAKKVIFIITGGEKGIICFETKLTTKNSECYYSPVSKIKRTGDTTGAGDVWLLAFTINYYMTKNITRALAAATVITGLKIQGKDILFTDFSDKELQSGITNQEKKVHLLPIQKGIQEIL